MLMQCGFTALAMQRYHDLRDPSTLTPSQTEDAMPARLPVVTSGTKTVEDGPDDTERKDRHEERKPAKREKEERHERRDKKRERHDEKRHTRDPDDRKKHKKEKKDRKRRHDS
ncbi:hypothetical protein N665_0122s0071 [Sinapis alba]|nr:hypothetical protein N665_0122s0071 [Sinapis alba]